MGYDFFQTRCGKCDKLLGEHWFYEEYSMFVSKFDAFGSWGLKKGDLCSCGGIGIVKRVDNLERDINHKRGD